MRERQQVSLNTGDRLTTFVHRVASVLLIKNPKSTPGSPVDILTIPADTSIIIEIGGVSWDTPNIPLINCLYFWPLL